MKRRTFVLALAASCLVSAALPARAQAQDEARRLVAAMLGATPMTDDLRALTDEIGGRATGSDANLAAVQWGLERFRSAGVTVRREAFEMPAMWLERSATATVQGAGIVTFAPHIAAMPFSTPTAPAGLTAPAVDGGRGTAEDFQRLGASARGAWVVVQQDLLQDIDGLFREYAEAAEIETRAIAAGVAGVIYESSRADGLLYRHNASLGEANRTPMFIMERSAAGRVLRLLRAGRALTVTAKLDLQTGGPYQSANVVGEIRGTTHPDEYVVIGAHLDAWDLGTGALDNGANAAMIIDLARQMQALGLRPARTIRFVLWNGEEQGMVGSWKYARAHRDELDRTVMTASFDIGTGRIIGFFTGGRPDVVAAVEHALEPVRGLGPFAQVDAPIVGTDNYDFMMEGVPNIVANQEPATYGPNYHAASDTYDKADLTTLRTNAAVAAAVTWYFATADLTLPRQTRAQVEALVASTDLLQQMQILGGLKEAWLNGTRGRARQ